MIKKKLSAYFSKLPVVRDDNVSLLPWGRRKEQEGNLPLGGWARLESIAVKRQYLQPRQVKIAVDVFMEKDHNKDSPGLIWSLILLFRGFMSARVMKLEFML